MTPRVDVLLRKIDEGVAEVRDHYDADLATHELSDELLYAVMQVVRDARSALDWTATAIKDKYLPGGKWTPYFPYIKEKADFPAAIENRMKGLTAKAPDVVAAIERHQPYQPDKEELGHLPALSKINNHRDFTAQTRDETRWVEVGGGPGEASVGFRPYDPSQPEKGGVEFGGRVYMDGIEVDPQTLEPIGGGRKPYTETIYVDWRFVEPSVSVQPTLDALAQLVREAVEDIRRTAGLWRAKIARARRSICASPGSSSQVFVRR